MIPTAEEFFNLKAQQKGWKDHLYYLAFDTANTEFDKNLLIQWTIEFAKLCCAEQAKVISEKVILNIDGKAEISNGQQYLVDSGNHYCETEIKIDKDSILNAYPLDNIK